MFLRADLPNGGAPPAGFLERVARAVEAGDLEVLVASGGGGMLGVLVLAFRPGFSLGGDFASVEELRVERGLRRRGIGRALVGAAERRARERGVSYVEVQTDGEAAPFYRAVGYGPDPDVRVLSRSLALGIQSGNIARGTGSEGGSR